MVDKIIAHIYNNNVSLRGESMKIDLSDFLDIRNNTISFSFSVSINDVPVEAEEFSSIVYPIHIGASCYKVDGEIIIETKGNFIYEAPCDRCLVESSNKINFGAIGKLIEEKARDSNEEEESDEVVYYKDRMVDLTDYIWSQIASSLPMKFLCSEDCKGLCQKCGKNLNEGFCSCSVEKGDLRFEKLRELSLND